ncbi:MAG: bL35 family ribosomal protein [Candidatus Absconditabacteria bacterium]
MAKRIKVTKTGKFIHAKAGVSHLLTNKNKAHRNDRSGRILSSSEDTKIKNLIAYKLR